MRFCQYSTLAALPLLALASPQGIQPAQDVQVAQTPSGAIDAALLHVEKQAMVVEALNEEADVVRLELRQAVEPAAAQPVAAQPVAAQPAADQPAAAQPAAAQPAAAQPAAVQPVTTEAAANAAAGAGTVNTAAAGVAATSVASVDTAVAGVAATSVASVDTAVAGVAATSIATTTAAAPTAVAPAAVAPAPVAPVITNQPQGIAAAGGPITSRPGDGPQASGFVTSYWIADHWDAEATSEAWAEHIYTQSFETYPGQMPSAASGSIGMGTHTGAIGIAKSPTSGASLMAQGTLSTIALGLAGVTLGMVGVFL